MPITSQSMSTVTEEGPGKWCKEASHYYEKRTNHFYFNEKMENLSVYMSVYVCVFHREIGKEGERWRVRGAEDCKWAAAPAATALAKTCSIRLTLLHARRSRSVLSSVIHVCGPPIPLIRNSNTECELIKRTLSLSLKFLLM